jgi:beta-galactosidase
VFVTVSVLDALGQCVPRSRAEIELSASGPGEIVAVDNGDPTSFEPFQATRRQAFNGLVLVILRARPRRKGRLVLTARSRGLARASLEVVVRRSAQE